MGSQEPGAGATAGAALLIEPPGFLQDPAVRAVIAALPAVRIVGGAVRDTLAGRPVADIDLATPDEPADVLAALDRAGLKHAPTGLQHGTVTAISGGRGFEVTTLRVDDRTDGRHAEVSWTPDWRQDAARRDFTINAMSMTPEGPGGCAVFDYFGGLEDLRARRVRFVGEPARRIAEDYLRVLRFFRFQARYGADGPDAATAQALRDAVPELDRLSVERVWSELKRILTVPDGLPAIELMARLGVLAAALRHGADLAALADLVRAGAPPDPLLRLAALIGRDAGRAVLLAERLKLSAAEAAELAALAGLPPDPAWDDDDLRRALAATPAGTWVARAWLAGGDGAPWAVLRARLTGMPRPVFPLAGRDAVALGVPPGPRVGYLLGVVRAWWLADGCVADAAACRAQLASAARR